MYQTISENSDSFVYQTISNKKQDTALIEQCSKLSSQCKSAKMLQDCFYDFQMLQATSEPYLNSSEHESEDLNSFYESTYNDQLYKACIKYNQWLNHNHYQLSKTFLNSNETIQEPNNSRYPDNVYQYPDFVKKSESESGICSSTDDTEILDNGNYRILMDDRRPPIEKRILNWSQAINCLKTNENLNSISQNLDSTRYMERLKAREFLADEKHVYKFPTQNKRTIPRVLKKYRYVPDVSSKQTERTNMANISFAESDNNYEDLKYQENCISDNLSKIQRQKRIICSRQPKRLTDYPDTHYRYPGISEVLEKQARPTRSPVENNKLENKEYFTREVSNQKRMTFLRQPESFQNYPGGDFEYQHLYMVDGQTNIEDKEKQENEGHYIEVPLCEISSSDQSEYLNLYPERKEHLPGFNQSLLQTYLDKKNLAESQVCSVISRMSTSEMREGFRNKHRKNPTLSRHYHSLDRKYTSQREPDLFAHLQIKEKLCMNDYNHQEEKCPSYLNSQKQPPLKRLLYPKSRYEITVYECSDPSCKCKESMLCFALKPKYQANYRGPNYQEHSATKPSSKNVMNSNPEIRGLFQNSHKKDYSLESNYWQGKYHNIAEKSDPKQSDLMEGKPKPDLFSIRDPNDFITTEEIAKIVRNLKLQSENYTELQSNKDNLKKVDNGNTSRSKELYEIMDAEPDYKVLSNLSLYNNIQSGISKSAQKNHSIFKKIFRKLNKKSTSESKFP